MIRALALLLVCQLAGEILTRWAWRRTASAPRGFAVDEIAGTFAGIAMGLNGVATSLVVPLLLRWL
jgi:hypothetical protein